MKMKFLLGVLAIGTIAMMNSCKDDEVPVAGVNFELAEQQATESDGTLESFHPDEENGGVGRLIPVKLVFDIPLAADAVFKIDVDGSARQTSNSTESNDFSLEGSDMLTVDGTNVTVLKGASEAILNIRIFEDYLPEWDPDMETTEEGIPYETVEVTIESVVSGPIKLGEAVKHTMKILEDDAYIYVDWTVDNTNLPGDANIDLLVYINNNYAGRSASSTTAAPYEYIVIPAGFPSTTYGLSYVYKSGTSNDVDFRVEIANYGGTLTKASGSAAPVLQFQGTYTLANLNNYTVPSPVTNKTQTIVKNSLNYTGVTELSVPATGSRVKPAASVSLRKLQSAKPTVIRYER